MTDRKREQRPWRAAVPAVMLLVGILLATSGQLAHGTDLRVGRRAELTDLIAEEERRGQQYRQRIAELRAEIDAVSRREARHDSRIDSARTQAEKVGARAGFAPASGSGVRVTLDDAAQSGSGQGGPGDPAPNDLVVHQQDVQAVVNALWAGGARAMQIMDQRVIATSAVRCVGNTLILQGVVYSPPYTITAVGDPQRLRTALADSEQVNVYKQYVRAYGLGYRVDELDDVRLPAYESTPDLDYATALPS